MRVAMVGSVRRAALPFAPNRLRTLNTGIAAIPPKRADPELLTPEHRAWRQAVLERAGWRCQSVDAGSRCMTAHPAKLFADHIHERRDGGDSLDVANGQALCGQHHAIKTRRARAERMARPT